ncbi:MAG: pilus assembly protein N-terminal domain-containing protein [Steroidobacteraceae bacterium]
MAASLPDRVSLAVGETVVLMADLKRAALGSGKVVSLATPERGQLLLFGEAPGRTSAELWLRDGTRRRLDIEVLQRDLGQRLSEVQELLRGSEAISARITGRFIVMEGNRASAEEQARAAEVAGLYPGEVLNFVGKIDWESMVEFQVRLIEIRRDQLDRLGVRWDADTAGPMLDATAGAGTGGLSLRAALASQLDSRIDLLQQKGMAYTLAEPTLSCRSGGVARFVSGGEVPIPITDGLGSTDVQYKEYGVILEVRPRADGSGAVYAEVEVELSQLDPAVRVGDFPGFLKRRTSTAINAMEGETIAIAGLVSQERGRDRSGLPGLSSIPVAGHLFRSTRRMERETELVVLITPTRFVAGRRPANEQPSQEVLLQRSDTLQQAGGRP